MITATELNNIEKIRTSGLEALSEKLGPIGMAQFIRLFDNGYGDYTRERREIVDNISKEEVLAFLK